MNTGIEHKQDITMQVGAGENQYLTFILNDEEYGVDILRVQEIRGWEQATTIPNAPEFVVGVINLRGMVIPIINLRKRFNIPDSDISSTTVIVIVKVINEGEERIVGMIVDAVSEVYNVSDEAMSDTPDLGSTISTNFIKGLATINEKMIVLLDIDLLINVGVLQATD
jgi:purine-binding chemotaxis protein CheW